MEITHEEKYFFVEKIDSGFRVHIKPEIVGVTDSHFGYHLHDTKTSETSAIDYATMHVTDTLLRRNKDLRKVMAIGSHAHQQNLSL